MRNREDGTVEAEAEGTAGALDEFEARLRSGNPAAIVERIETMPAPVQNEIVFRII